jgi:GNAT superfamily N-acetyltransferase
MEKLEIISWHDFQIGIAPLWKIEDPSQVPIYNNPFGLIQFKKELIHTNLIYFPCRYIYNNKVVGFISIYNLSYLHIRPRGIYILPEYQGKGLGHKMQKLSWKLFPNTFYRTFIITSQVERFCRNSKMIIFPNTPLLWSEFSQSFLQLLCYERNQYPNFKEIENNKIWIQSLIKEFGMGGTNNLNNNFTTKEWLNYFDFHNGNYKRVRFNLDESLNV